MNDKTPEAQQQIKAPVDYIDPKYKTIFLKVMEEVHGRAGLAALVASRLWMAAASSWLHDSISYAAQDVIKRDLTSEEYRELENNVDALLNDVNLGADAGDDLRSIQEAFKMTVTTYNQDAADKRKFQDKTMREKADKMPLPFLSRMLKVPGTVVYVKGEDRVVTEFMHMSVGYLLMNFIPVNVAADPAGDGGFTNGLVSYSQEHDVPFLIFIEKWAMAGADISFMERLFYSMKTRGPFVVRNGSKLFGTTSINSSLARGLLFATKRSGISMLVGIDDDVEVAKAKKAVVVSVEKRMEAGIDPNDPMVLGPVYYIDGQKCVFTVEGDASDQSAESAGGSGAAPSA